MQANKVVFIPAKRSPLKGFLPGASDEDRYTMISLAIEEREEFAISDYELKRPAPSYTLDTVRHFRKLYGPDTTLHWLIGADAVGDLQHWYKIEELIDECLITTMYRAGCEKPDYSRYEQLWGLERVRRLNENIIETPLIDISSTEIRKRVAAGHDVGGMLDKKVAAYIDQKGLYREGRRKTIF